MVFVIDAAKQPRFDATNSELKTLPDKPQLAHIPALIPGNKNDLPDAVSAKILVNILGSKEIKSR